MLTTEQRQNRETAVRFMQAHAVPQATAWDEQGEIPRAILTRMADQGLLGTFIGTGQGGRGWDALSFGLLCEQTGAASASLLSILTVHSMTLQAVAQWGTPEQKQRWLQSLATGKTLAAFALTEPDIGSDASNITTRIEPEGTGYRLTGRKKWISFGRHADVFLVMARQDKLPVALLVPRDTPGLTVAPMTGLLGFRSAGLAEITFDNCPLPAAALVGRIGGGFSHVASASLDLGRFCVAFGCLGIIEACTLDAVVYARRRRQFGVPIFQHELILELIADMITGAKSVRQLCYHAAALRQAAEPESILETTVAKYAASRTAARVAGHAVQVHGAMGCSTQTRVERMFRDARICEIIEGSNQMQQLMIARNGAAEYLREARRLEKGTGDGVGA